MVRRDSWKCSCGVTVRRAEPQGDEDPEQEGDLVELDGVVHSCDVEDDEDF
jgi:hypothetical protein